VISGEYFLRRSHFRLGRIFWGLSIAIALYALLAVLVGWRDLSRHLALFPWSYAVPLAALSLTNYLLRFWRWEFYLRTLKIVIPRRDSLAIFFATFVMVITPGKLGEAFKAALLWEKHAVPLSLGLPVILAERLFDLLAVSALACLGLLFWSGGTVAGATIPLVALFLLGALMAVRNSRLRRWLLTRAARTRHLRKHQLGLEEALQTLSRLLTGRGCAGSTALSLLAWFCECLSLALVCRALGHSLTVTDAIFVYAVGTLVGSLTFLPGGLGGTEGTLIWLLSQRGIATDLAAVMALVVRIATLWLAVAIGLVALAAGRHLLIRPPADAYSPDGSQGKTRKPASASGARP
jgi:uncharacterized protein (TIRG00374 family)